MIRPSRRTVLLFSCAPWICSADRDPSWRTRVTNPGEPGERLIIRGRVLRSPGGAPAPGTVILVYQTDATGIYSTREGHPRDTARLRGQFTAGPRGEYEIVTIKPGAYPGGGVPAHIHVNVVEPAKPPREIFEYFFAGDASLEGGEKGYVLRPVKDEAGTWVAVQDIALTPDL